MVLVGEEGRERAWGRRSKIARRMSMTFFPFFFVKNLGTCNLFGFFIYFDRVEEILGWQHGLVNPIMKQRRFDVGLKVKRGLLSLLYCGEVV